MCHLCALLLYVSPQCYHVDEWIFGHHRVRHQCSHRTIPCVVRYIFVNTCHAADYRGSDDVAVAKMCEDQADDSLYHELDPSNFRFYSTDTRNCPDIGGN